MNEKDISKSLMLKELRNNKYYNYFKSDYIKQSYSQLLIASNDNILYYKNLITNTNNIHTKYYYTKLLIQHAELIKICIIKTNELLEYLCKNTKKNTINDLKHDLLILYIFEYKYYKEALDYLYEIQIFYKNIHKYDIINQIDMLNYKICLAQIEYTKFKLEYDNVETFTNVSNNSNKIILIYFIIILILFLC
jgi:hypothetical protein